MSDEADLTRALQPTDLIDSDHPDVVAFAKETVGDARTDVERVARLFETVRDSIWYDPWTFGLEPEHYRASNILGRERSFCVPKAILLAAACRAVGIPARVGFADVKNHLASDKLRRSMGTDLFVFHGYDALFVGGRWIEVTPAFNRALCERFGVPALEFDGVHDAMLQPFDGEGNRYMEYVTDHGLFDDVPFERMVDAWRATYGRELKRPDEPDAAFR